MLNVKQKAVEVMKHLCEHEAHGYSQPGRKGNGSDEVLTLSDGSRVTVHDGDYDCSEAVRTVWAALDVLPVDSYLWTGNQDDMLIKYGFKRYQFKLSDLQTADVLWKQGHTELYMGDGLQGGFNGDENGGIGEGAKEGDQTGYESYIKPVRGYWVYIYRYEGCETYAGYEGWIKAANGKWWYRYRDGRYARSQWLRYDDSWYLFDSKGWMITGWVESEGSWYYLEKSGRMFANGCMKRGNQWYAFDKHGHMMEGSILTRSNGSMIL